MDMRQLNTRQVFTHYILPQMIGLVCNSIYFIVDGIFIGKRLGPQALAAAGLCVPVVECMIALSMLLSVGGGILCAHEAGQNRFKDAGNTFQCAITITLALSVFIALAGNILAKPITVALGASPAILGDTMDYFRYFISFTPFFMFSFVLSTFVRNDGRPKLAMIALTVGSVANIVLDYVFMYPLGMGMKGAALATGLGPVFSVMILLPHFIQKKGRLYFQRLFLSKKITKNILIYGIPAFISEFSIGFVTLLYNMAIVKSGLGEQGLAAYLVIGYLALISLSLFLGAGQGIQPIISFWAGAKKYAAVQKLFQTVVWWGVVFAVFLYSAIYLGSSVIYRIFIENDPALVDFTAGISKLYFLFLPFAAVNILCISFLQSLEQVRPSLWISLSRSTLPVCFFLWFLPLAFPAYGLWLAMTATECLTLALALLLWSQYRKQLLQIQITT